MTADFAECWICDDCSLWHTNADISGIDNPDRVLAVTQVTQHFIVDCGKEAEHCLDFSTARCDACRTPVAGSRHRSFVEVTR